MADFNTDMNIQFPLAQPIQLVHEYSTTDFFIGVSTNGNDTSKATWQIKKITKVGDVWFTTQFPNGNQLFIFIWDNRLLYTYI